MVQAPDITMKHKDLPQALMLLGEMNLSAQHVASLVDNMIQKVRKGELTTDQGLSFLEMKYNMLLSYLINLTYVVLRKCSGEKIEGDPCIDRLIEIRTVLEKIKPIDNKLKYQIDKLVKTAVSGTNADDPTKYKANPENLLGNLEEDEGSSDEDDIKQEGSKRGVYVPPKLSAVHYIGDETAQDRTKRLQEKSKRHALSASIMQDLREEYLDTPTEVSQGSRAQQILSKQQREKQEYEEEYMTRLPVSKSEKQKHRHLTTLGSLGDEITNFVSENDFVCCSKQDEEPNLNDQDELEIPNITEISTSEGLKIENIYLKSLLRHKNIIIIRSLENQLKLLKGVSTQPPPIYSNLPPPNNKNKNCEASANEKGIVVIHNNNQVSLSSTGAIPRTIVKSSTTNNKNTDCISKDEGRKQLKAASYSKLNELIHISSDVEISALTSPDKYKMLMIQSGLW
ncbi:hypothetical protein JTB14_032073 [Gonioctena quinquepunctata]|nr:hypothetical protein JTB14_032073 [Gonioctena quinquepunctata]